MLTTIDNPYNPYKDYDKWFTWDCSHLYYTSQVLARMYESLESNDEVDDEDIDELIDTIVRNDVLGIYAHVGPNDQCPLSSSSFIETNNELKQLNE